ncbi:MAG: HEAT repeat domain-containing protein [Planctomycetota bacterium]|nr:HEAT repeat domain-containing protein [Planctomycetota bacterium]
MDAFAAMEECLQLASTRGAGAVAEIKQRLSHPDWRVRYAAAVALGDRRAAEAVPELLAALAAEDAAPLFSQPRSLGGGPAGSPAAREVDEILRATPPEVLEAWRRRGRLKQAICLALAEIGPAAKEAMPILRRYAVDQSQDYAVRAAACHALGRIAPEANRDVLLQASQDEEWCTRTEARKALRRVSAAG